MAGLLDGIKVIEMTHHMAGPTCGLMLADMGADVVKVERKSGEDPTRNNAPFVDGRSAPFAVMNRNKRSLVLDTHGADGLATLKRLIGGADVFIENYRPGAMTHYGVDFETIHAEFPHVIYCSVSGFGQTGPYAGLGGFDLVAQGMSGLMSITGEGPGRPPVKVGAPVTDIVAGLQSTIGVLGAIVKRGITGKGQMVDASLLEAGISLTYWQSAIHMGSGEVPGAMGSAHPMSAPYQAFQTADGWINIGGASEANWQKLIECLDAPGLGTDPRFVTNADRMANLAELDDELSHYFKTRTTDDWLEKLRQIGVPAGPVLTIEQMVKDPQALARNMILETPETGREPVRVIGHPVKYSDAETDLRHADPVLGQHSQTVLSDYGFSSEEIETLTASGAIVQSAG